LEALASWNGRGGLAAQPWVSSATAAKTAGSRYRHSVEHRIAAADRGQNWVIMMIPHPSIDDERARALRRRRA